MDGQHGSLPLSFYLVWSLVCFSLRFTLPCWSYMSFIKLQYDMCIDNFLVHLNWIFWEINLVIILTIETWTKTLLNAQHGRVIWENKASVFQDNLYPLNCECLILHFFVYHHCLFLDSNNQLSWLFCVV